MSRAAGIAVLLVAVTLTLHAQVRLPGGASVPPLRLPSLADLTRGEPPLTTDINSVPLHGWPELDRLRLDGFVPLTNADRGANLAFQLRPGRYELALETFCARGYTYGPTEGDGYVLGAWTGSKAEVLRDVMRRYTARGDSVDQKDVQLLVWAILSRANPQDLRGGARRALVQLFDDQGAALLARGALDHYSEDALRKLLAPANRTMRPLLEYENRMRGMFRDGSRTYEDFERLAMLPPPRDAKTLIPAERWNIHPGGYLVRFSSAGYSRSTMQVVVPGAPVITRDAMRRVTRFALDDYALHITYLNDAPGVPYPGDRNLVAHAVSRVRIDVPASRGGALEREVEDWIFTGTPAKRTPRNRQAVRVSAGLIHAAALSSALPGSGEDGTARHAGRAGGGAVQFGNWGRRADRAIELRDRLETYEEWYAREERIRRGERPDEDVFDSGHVGGLIDSIFGGSDDRLEQIGETHGRLAEWLAHATRLLDGMGGEGGGIDPTDRPFAPGRSGGQTIISSGRTR
jgi:hypothetical protein